MTDHGTTTCIEVPRAEQIARLNDRLRRGDSSSGTVMITQGVRRITGFDAAAPYAIAGALAAVVFLIINLGAIAILISIHDRHKELAEGVHRIAQAIERRSA